MRPLVSWLSFVALVRHCAHSLSSVAGGRPSIDAAPFGEHRGVPVTKWTLRGGGDLEVAVISYGATLVSARSADRAGAVDELTLNYATLAPIVAPTFPYLGSTVGRVANRVSNARFELDGVTHALAANHFSSCLHGGPDGWGRRPWVLRDARADASGAALTLALRSADGDGGFPGAVEAEATFAVAGDELTLAWRATCDAPTPVAMTNHAYWNLAGPAARRGAAEHSLHVDARARLEVNREAVPTGAVLPVAGTPYDLRWPKGAHSALAAPKLGSRILAADSGDARNATNSFICAGPKPLPSRFRCPVSPSECSSPKTATWTPPSNRRVTCTELLAWSPDSATVSVSSRGRGAPPRRHTSFSPRSYPMRCNSA